MNAGVSHWMDSVDGCHIHVHRVFLAAPGFVSMVNPQELVALDGVLEPHGSRGAVVGASRGAAQGL